MTPEARPFDVGLNGTWCDAHSGRAVNVTFTGMLYVCERCISEDRPYYERQMRRAGLLAAGGA
jgi:hypothetical protein